MSEPINVDDEVRWLERRFNMFLYDELFDVTADATIETWIRGVPSVRLSWMGTDGIGRNITAFTEDGPVEFRLEVNAWHDPEGGGETRRWFHEDLGPVSPGGENLRVRLSDAYNQIDRVTVDDLGPAVDADDGEDSGPM